MDIAGRLVTRRDLRGLGAGPHSLALPGTALVPGVYMLRLQQAGQTVRMRGVVVY
jgi:hypothetical protein